jgi:asparagine synthase (glutamine-hydrolysing)
MTDSIRHRGPDDHGYLLLDSRDGTFSLERDLHARPSDVLLGSRRLAIIDTSSAGRQPMTNEDGTVFLAFNGAIYNYLELRRELAGAGHRFVSETDTEVIVHGYEQWGPDCVSRFNGMWAFALWDQRQRRFFCSRDRFGVKPLYYFLDEELFIFASEIKAILEARPSLARPDPGPIRAFLTERALARTDATFFSDIKRLPGAHSLLLSAGTSTIARYWDYDSRTHGHDTSRPEDTFRELLADSVALRLRSDVPVGIALSGGLDSSSIAVLARQRANGHPFKVFTAEFPGNMYDERRYAELVARRCGMEFHVASYRPTNLIDDLRRVVWHMDHPVLLGQVLPRWDLMELASRHVKVILEGQGGDEILAGYVEAYFAAFVVDRLRSLAPRRLPTTLGQIGAAAFERYRLLQPGTFRVSLSRRRPQDILSREFRELTRSIDGKSRVEHGDGERLDDVLRADHGWRLLPHLLMFGDAISMGHSLESRLPFLDYRLVEFMFGLPSSSKFDGVRSKIILRRALKDVLPAEILARRDKVGFATPAADWLRSQAAAGVGPLLSEERTRRRGILDPRALDRLVRGLERGDSLAPRMVFRAIALEIWFRLFIDGDRDPERPLPR